MSSYWVFNGGVRASDADRAATARTLQDAVGRGLLTYEEGSDRMAAAYAARFLTALRRRIEAV